MNRTTSLTGTAAGGGMPMLGQLMTTSRRFAQRKPLGAFSMAMILVLAALALLAPVALADPTKINLVDALAQPSLKHWFGTDNFGRDLFARVASGGRVSLTVGFAAAFLGYSVGGLIGLVSGFRGGWVDAVLQRIMDTLMALPRLILALAVVIVLGASLFNIILAIALASVPEAARVVRSVALSVRTLDFVLAARAVGCTDFRVMARHVAPQLVAPFLVVFTAAIGWSILIESAISFLGFGIPPPTPTWGRILSSEGMQYLRAAPWVSLFAGLAITLAVYSFNLLGDSLRDVIDPYLRHARAG